MARKRNPLRLTLNALYELIEKTLVDNNAYMVAKSLLLNRSRKISVSRESRPQSSSASSAATARSSPGMTRRSRSPSARPSSRSARLRARRCHRQGRLRARPRLQPGLRPHRGGPGHRAGGAHEGRPLQGRRGLHPFPRRAAPTPARTATEPPPRTPRAAPQQASMIVVKKRQR